MKKIVLTIFTIISYLHLFSQQFYDSVLMDLQKKYPQEKIYMQLDKFYYLPGETIWFKAYLKFENPAIQSSTNLYAELINDAGNVIDRKIMPIVMSGAASQFIIPDSATKNQFYIRAYTTQMLNYDSSLLYTKPVNLLLKNEIEEKQLEKKYSIVFFPEGGDLANGVESRVAFKTSNEHGDPFYIEGTIVTNTGKIVNSIKSIHNGMGYFNLKPEAGETYRAVWKKPDAVVHETILPYAKDKGVTLRLDQQNKSIIFSISRPDTLNDDNKELVLIAQVKNSVAYAVHINLNKKNSASSSIPTDSLPEGIMQVTLFNKNHIPVAERLVFIRNSDEYFITDVRLIDKKLEPKSKNELQIEIPGTFKTNLSISVTDADVSIQPVLSENIFSDFLLSSDLKGKIYDPAYYFSGNSDTITAHLDLVMLTNGWRRFNWKKLLAGQYPKSAPTPEKYFTLKGKVQGLNSAQLKDRTLSGFISVNTDHAFINTPIEKDGSFIFEQLYFFDTLKLYYQLNNDKNKKLTGLAKFTFEDIFPASPKLNFAAFSQLQRAPKPSPLQFLKTITSFEEYKELLSVKIKTLESVSVTAKNLSFKEKVDKEYTSGVFRNPFSTIIAPDEDPNAIGAGTILEYLRNKVHGIRANLNVNPPILTMRNRDLDFYLNEMPASVEFIQTISLYEVAMIKIFDYPFLGTRGSPRDGGAVAVYTKKGDFIRRDLKGLNLVELQGYSSYKEFYSPDYSLDKEMKPDYRSTLYWNPFVFLDDQNKTITIPFYNNSTAKKIRIIVEGINENGQLTRHEQIIE